MNSLLSLLSIEQYATNQCDNSCLWLDMVSRQICAWVVLHPMTEIKCDCDLQQGMHAKNKGFTFVEAVEFEVNF